MIHLNEVLLRSREDWLYFSNPHRIIRADQLNLVTDALDEIEDLVAKNNWCAAGFVSYEAAPAFDPAFKFHEIGDFPFLWFGLYPAPQKIKIHNSTTTPPIELRWSPAVERERYKSAIDKIREYIAEGKTYQVNYTMQLDADFFGSEWDFFLRLTNSQNKYAAYLNIGDHIICSASPELFFKLDGEKIYSMPMKGTTRRGRTQEQDVQQAEWLRNSLKNRAENIMIVDMIRNDLGRIARLGTVEVPAMFEVEKYSTVFQMTTTVQAKTKASLKEIFSALFPCASITGAPKVSAMKIISELEQRPRKIYTGSIGYYLPDRKAQFSVAIRTALINTKTSKVEYGVGGGIVWDSESSDEYQEALLKAKVLSSPPMPEFSLVETLLWTPEENYFLLEKHLRRLQRSAEYFDFPFPEKLLENMLKGLKSKSPLKVRILLHRNGLVDMESSQLTPSSEPYTASINQSAVHTDDIFLYHKTTNRSAYPVPQPPFNDVLLVNQIGAFTEFTIGNLVVELDGRLYTPPIQDGLLPGVFRAHLLETKLIQECSIYKSDLIRCEKIFMINSVRKWTQVKLEIN